MDIGIKYGGAGSGRITNAEIITAYAESETIPPNTFVTMHNGKISVWYFGDIYGLTKTECSPTIAGELWKWSA